MLCCDWGEKNIKRDPPQWISKNFYNIFLSWQHDITDPKAHGTLSLLCWGSCRLKNTDVESWPLHLCRKLLICRRRRHCMTKCIICAVADGVFFALVFLKKATAAHVHNRESFGRAIGQSVWLPAPMLFLAACQTPVCSPARPPLCCCCAYLSKKKGEEGGGKLAWTYDKVKVSLDKQGKFGCCAFIKLQPSFQMSLSS